ncbi:hypothetical protein [Pedobacter sp.]|jgi:hypothetical protein|uniref:hypothetical protein n=1 Tax=Pedobacter sp. TaxID=1411316 RepID=UPI002D1ACA1D|nr:hypothetical protein [Pedobacter sp.]HWW42861.1 hypothetical protein [Pedobacter sp.]
MLKDRLIPEENLTALFDFLAKFLEMPYKNFKSHVSKQLIKCTCEKDDGPIHWVGDISYKCWFVVKGIVIIYMNGKDGRLNRGFFKAGEIAILPNSFKNSVPSESGLIGVVDTELLEISTFQMQQIYDEFPKSLDLESKIISSVVGKSELRDRLLKLPVQERVDEFHEIFPETKGKNRTVKLLDKDKANYLNIGETYLSRFCADDREE